MAKGSCHLLLAPGRAAERQSGSCVISGTVIGGGWRIARTRPKALWVRKNRSNSVGLPSG